MSDDLQTEPAPSFHLGFLRQLWPFVRPYRRGFAGCLVLLGASFAVELLGPWVIRLALDGPMQHRGPGATTELLLYGLAFAATVAAGTWLGWVYGLRTAWNGQRVVRDVRRTLVAHLLRLPPDFYDRNPAGRLTTRATTDVENLNELISTGVLQTVFDLLKIAGILLVLFWLNVPLALLALTATPAVIGLSLWFRRRASVSFAAVRGALGDQNGTTAELVGGIRAVRAYGMEAQAMAHYRAANLRTAEAWRETVACFSLFFALVDGALRLAAIGLLYIGMHALDGGSMAMGEFVQFWLYYGLLSGPIKELGEKYNVLQAAFASASRIFALLDEAPFPPPPAPEVSRVLPPPRCPAPVSFAGVDFTYGREPVLRGIDLEVPAGTTVAVVGPTGAGKSTLLSLVTRNRDPQRGSVRVHGIDVRHWPTAELRRRIAVVPQDVFLFRGSVLDNLRRFDPSLSLGDVEAAIAELDLTDWIGQLPDGLHTVLHERGGGISQGHRQLVALGRALLTRSDVLILDEATASLDSETEQRLQRAMSRAGASRTVLVVAHRLATVRYADQIAVLERGTIIERGSHHQLVQMGGAYARMVANAAADVR